MELIIISPSAGKSSERQRERSKEHRRSKGIDKTNDKPEKPTTKDKTKEINGKKKQSNKSSIKKRILTGCVATMILVLLGGGAAVIFLFGIIDEPNYCDDILKEPTDHLELQICQQLVCDFDISRCSTPCPFGFNEDEERCPNACTCATDGTIFQGDIQFNEAELPNMLQTFDLLQDDNSGVSLFSASNAIVANPLKRWRAKSSDGYYKIPYEPCPDCSNELLQAIEEAFELVSKETCLDFIEKTTELQSMFFTIEPGCYSKVGKQIVRRGQQSVNLGGGCERPGVIAHELLHLIGFVHEESRRDRDLSIKVDYEIIKSEFKFHFKKLSAKGVFKLNSEYDVESIMQNSGYMLSKNKEPTILNLYTGKPVTYQRTHLSEIDYEEINEFYKCDGRIATTTARSVALTTTPATLSPQTPPVITTTTIPSVIITTSTTQSGQNSSIDTEGLHWSEWGAWDGCDECVAGTEGSRVRECINGVAAECINKFDSENYETRDCSLVVCRGNWEDWNSWQKCSRTCGGGLALRSRSCNQAFCEGDENQAKRCNSQECDDASSWSDWAVSSKCDRSCGPGGVKVLKRLCLPSNDDSCEGNRVKLEKCDEPACPVGDAASTDPETSLGDRPGDTPGDVGDTPGDLGDTPGDLGDTPGDLGNGSPSETGGALGNYGRDNQRLEDGLSDFPRASTVFEHSSLTVPKVLCQSELGTRWVFGDFNGDQKADVVCGRDNGRFQVGLTSGDFVVDRIHKEKKLKGCNRGAKFSGDFNGDGFQDLLCKDRAHDSLSIKLWENGGFSSGVAYDGKFCLEYKEKIYLLDMNGDGKTDIMCERDNQGYEVMLSPVT